MWCSYCGLASTKPSRSLSKNSTAWVVLRPWRDEGGERIDPWYTTYFGPVSAAARADNPVGIIEQGPFATTGSKADGAVLDRGQVNISDDGVGDCFDGLICVLWVAIFE